MNPYQSKINKMKYSINVNKSIRIFTDELVNGNSSNILDENDIDFTKLDICDIIKVLCNWKNDCKISTNYDIIELIESNQNKYKFDDQVKKILTNSARKLYKYHLVWRYYDDTYNDKGGHYLADSRAELYKLIDHNINIIDKDTFKYGPNLEFLYDEYNNWKYDDNTNVIIELMVNYNFI